VREGSSSQSARPWVLDVQRSDSRVRGRTDPVQIRARLLPPDQQGREKSDEDGAEPEGEYELVGDHDFRMVGQEGMIDEHSHRSGHNAPISKFVVVLLVRLGAIVAGDAVREPA